MNAKLTESEWRLLKGRHDDEWFIVAGDIDADGGPDLHATILTANPTDARAMANAPNLLKALIMAEALLEQLRPQRPRACGREHEPEDHHETCAECRMALVIDTAQRAIAKATKEGR